MSTQLTCTKYVEIKKPLLLCLKLLFGIINDSALDSESNCRTLRPFYSASAFSRNGNILRGLVSVKDHPEESWEPVIGLEIHAQIRSRRKLFSDSICADLNAAPNTHVSWFDAAYPGTLPKLNVACVDQALRAALAFKCKIALNSRFDRKHYFYHDLPAGYQITQKYEPIAQDGVIMVGNNPLDQLPYPLQVDIEQLQLEQDTAKTTVNEFRPDEVMIDLNRAGMPLLEIVTRPCFRTSDEVVAFLRKLQGMLRALRVSDASMDEGSFRVDVNVSVRKFKEPLGVRTELKNLASLKVIQQAIDYEIKRHIQLLEGGIPLKLETRGYDALGGKTFRLRSKNENTDYMYFPDPDLSPVVVSEERLKQLQETLPELPDQARGRLKTQYALSDYHLGILLNAPEIVQYYESVVQENHHGKKRDPHVVVNWITNTLFGILSTRQQALFDKSREPVINAAQLGSIIDAVSDGKMATHQGKEILEYLLDHPDVRHKVASDFLSGDATLSITSTNEAVLMRHIRDLVKENPKGLLQLGGYMSGQSTDAPKKLKPATLTWFAGHTMRRVKGQADPKVLKEAMRKVMVDEFHVPALVFAEWLQASKDSAKSGKK